MTGLLLAISVALVMVGIGGLMVADNALTHTRAMPNGAATVASTGWDLGLTTRGDLVANVEILISTPALAVGVLADAATCRWDVFHSDNADFSGEAVLMEKVLLQTGAGGAGAAAATARVRLPVDVKRFVRLKATKSGAGDASGSSATLSLVF